MSRKFVGLVALAVVGIMLAAAGSQSEAGHCGKGKHHGYCAPVHCCPPVCQPVCHPAPAVVCCEPAPVCCAPVPVCAAPAPVCAAPGHFDGGYGVPLNGVAPAPIPVDPGLPPADVPADVPQPEDI